MMKKSIIAMLLLLSLLVTGLVYGEDAPQKVSYLGKFTCDVDVEYINMDKVRVTDMDAFVAFLRKLPNVK